MTFLFHSMVWPRPKKQDSCLRKRVTISISRIPPSFREQSTHTTPYLRNWTSGGSLITKHGGWMKDTMVRFKASIKLKRRPSMEKSSCCNGEEAIIFHHQPWNLMMKGIHNMHHSIKSCRLLHFHVLNRLKSLLIESSHSGTIPYAHLCLMAKTSSLLPTETPWEQ